MSEKLIEDKDIDKKSRFRKKVLLSTAVVMAVLGGRESAEAQTSAGKPKKFKENLAEKFANVSPKLTSMMGIHLLIPIVSLVTDSTYLYHAFLLVIITRKKN